MWIIKKCFCFQSKEQNQNFEKQSLAFIQWKLNEMLKVCKSNQQIRILKWLKNYFIKKFKKCTSFLCLWSVCTLNTKKFLDSTNYSFSCKTRADIKNEVRHLKKCKKNNYKIELITKFTRLFIRCGKLEKIL